MRVSGWLIILLAPYLFNTDPVGASERTIAVRGTVTDHETGEPLRGANVYLMPMVGELSGDLAARSTPYGETTTSSQGRFALSKLPLPIKADLIIVLDGYVEYLSVIDCPNAARPQELDVALIRGHPVDTYIREDELGLPDRGWLVVGPPQLDDKAKSSPPYAGAPSYVFKKRRVPIRNGGLMRIHALPGSYRVDTYLVDRLRSFFSFHSPTTRKKPQRLHFPGGSRFEGRVRSGYSGKPVEGCEIRFKEDIVAFTDAEGRFVARGITSSGPRLQVTHPDYEVATVQAKKNKANEIELRGPRVLIARFPGVKSRTIEIETKDYVVSLYKTGNGGYRSHPIGASAGEGVISYKQGKPATVSWPAGRGVHDLGSIQLAAGGGVRVLVLDANEKPVRWAWVRAESMDGKKAFAQTSSNKEGEAPLNGLPKVPFRLVVGAGSHRVSSMEVESEEKRPDLIKITLFKGGSVILRVVDENGEPMSGVRGVIVEDTPSGPKKRGSTSGKSGRIDIRTLPSGQPLKLTLKRESTEDGPMVIQLPPLAEGEYRKLGKVELKPGHEQ